MKFKSVARRAWLIGVVFVLIGFTWLAPAQARQPAQQDIAQITSPTDGQALAGLVTITGSADHPEFARWELAYGPDPNPNDAWQPFASGQQQINNGTLGTWNTGVVADGGYMLRLRVVRKDSNYSEAVVRGLKVSNSAPLAPPTSIPPAPTFPAEQVTFTAQETVQPPQPVMVEQPPTTVPVASPAPNSPVKTSVAPNQANTMAAAFNLALFGTACLNGIVFAVGLFVVVGVVQISRWGYRQIRRRRK